MNPGDKRKFASVKRSKKKFRGRRPGESIASTSKAHVDVEERVEVRYFVHILLDFHCEYI